ncbi:hypothetical protein BASA61_007859 [Batrachochytrium salamandrivorans]|nr:hypothetical protein BASA61_007859 [Batrachochytrium salamandrivorans]
MVHTLAIPTQTQLTQPIQLHGINLPSVSQYEYLGVIIDDLLTLSPWLVKKKRAITAAVHSISPLLRNNFLSTRYRLTIFNGLVLGVAYYGLELIGGNSTLTRRLQAPVNTGIRMILKAPLFTPIAPMLTDCGIISLDTHAILARVRLTVKATTLKTPLRALLLPYTIPSHSSSWFWTRRSSSLIRLVHPNMSLFHFNIPISTNGLFHNPISTNSSITSSNINRSIPNTPSLHTSNTTTSTTIPSTPTICRDPTPVLQVCIRTYIPSLGQVQIGLQLCAGEPRVKCQIFALAGPQRWPGHRCLSPLTGPLWWPMELP